MRELSVKDLIYMLMYRLGKWGDEPVSVRVIEDGGNTFSVPLMGVDNNGDLLINIDC